MVLVAGQLMDFEGCFHRDSMKIYFEKIKNVMYKKRVMCNT